MAGCGFNGPGGIGPGGHLRAALTGRGRSGDTPRLSPPLPPPLTDDRGRTLTLRGWNVEDKTHRGAEALSAPDMARFYGEALASLDRYSSGWAGYVWCYGGGYCAVGENGRFGPHKEQTARPFAPAVAGSVRRQGYDPAARTYRLVYDSPGRSGVSELSTPPTAVGWRVSVQGAAVVRPSAVPAGERGTVRVRTRPGGSGQVTVTVSARE
ncbi:hypothetical protein HUT19_34960 [Streptomyces sp. NA02950]|nr:hypothetical protein HUT19_34960 [Streptomyces sp. NA02950]